jgi:hypothetical protein
MKRTAAVLFSAIVSLAPQVLEAQTLDELQHPLLPKGKAAATAEYENYAVEHVAGDYASGLTVTYFKPQYVVFPQFRVGLARGLELRLDGTNQFPTLFSDPGFAAWTHGGHALYTTAIRSVAGTVLFRPVANVELRGFYLWGRSRDDLNYTSGSGPVTEIYESQTGTTDVVSVAGTWVSAAGRNNRSLESNLDGLHHPLLARRHWRLDWELMHRWYDYGYHTSEPYIIVEGMRSRDTRVWFGVGYGVSDRLQMHADGYWHPPFRLTDTSQSTSTWNGKTTVGTADFSTRYAGVFGWRLNGTWRVNQRVEVFVEGTRERQGISPDTAFRSGPIETYRTTTTRFGGTWLSRRPKSTGPLAADLPGLYHPLVETKQIKVDGLVDHFGYRGDILAPGVWLWRLQATTGLSSFLQASAFGGAMYVERSGSAKLPDRYSSLGANLTLRLKSCAEMFGTVNLHPAGFFNTYPLFILGRDDPYHAYHDFLSNDFGGDRTLHVGLRLVL